MLLAHEASRVPLKRVGVGVILAHVSPLKGNSVRYSRDSPTLLVTREMFSEHLTNIYDKYMSNKNHA